MNDRGMHILGLLDRISQNHQATPAEVSLAWLIAQKEVTAPIASATTLPQLQSLVKSLTLRLNNEEVELLNKA